MEKLRRRGRDFISDLPECITEIILTKLPIGDAVRTSILSRNWRYQWTALRELTFDDDCVVCSDEDRCCMRFDDSDRMTKFGEKIVKFIMKFLLLHQGIINKFKLETNCILDVPDLDQWILFLSRKDVEEISLHIGETFRVPLSIFLCLKLTTLELAQCSLVSPPEFKGFPCLKYLDLFEVDAYGVIDEIISAAPLLEMLRLRNMEDLYLKVRAPNLKYLFIDGEFIDIFFEYAPLLTVIGADMEDWNGELTEAIMDRRIAHEISGWNSNFLGGVPSLERLKGNITKPGSLVTRYTNVSYLNVDDLGKSPVQYDCLRKIYLNKVSFEERKEKLVLLHLMVNSPNLEILGIGGDFFTYASEPPDLDFWEIEPPIDCTFKRLKSVQVLHFYFERHEMEFLRFVHGNSPVLEVVKIQPRELSRKTHIEAELQQFPKTSAEVEIELVD